MGAVTGRAGGEALGRCALESCRLLLDPVLTGAGFTMHPLCEFPPDEPKPKRKPKKRAAPASSPAPAVEPSRSPVPVMTRQGRTRPIADVLVPLLAEEARGDG